MNGSASDDTVCCDDDEGSVSVMACAVQVGDARGSENAFKIVCDDAVQNIELLKAVCCCKNKAVQVT